VNGSRVICVDFDGVLCRRAGPWRGAGHVEGELIPGAAEALIALLDRYRVVIHTSRALVPEGKQAVHQWLIKQGLGGLYVNVQGEKRWARNYVDDRAVCFRGDWRATIREIRNFTPWTEIEAGQGGAAPEAVS
jgi:phosphoglycolate phosphatase-like HAD superfamily hydrolase